MEDPRRLGRGDRNRGGRHPGTRHHQIGLSVATAGGAAPQHHRIGSVAAHREAEARRGSCVQNDIGRLQGGTLQAGGAGATGFHLAGQGRRRAGGEGRQRRVHRAAGHQQTRGEDPLAGGGASGDDRKVAAADHTTGRSDCDLGGSDGGGAGHSGGASKGDIAGAGEAEAGWGGGGRQPGGTGVGGLGPGQDRAMKGSTRAARHRCGATGCGRGLDRGGHRGAHRASGGRKREVGEGREVAEQE